MHIRIDLFNFLRPPVSKFRSVSIPAEAPGGRIRGGIKLWARHMFEEESARLGFDREWMDRHIDTFFAELGWEGDGPIDRDHKLTFERGDLRLIIENTSPATVERENEAMRGLLDDLDPPQTIEEATPERTLRRMIHRGDIEGTRFGAPGVGKSYHFQGADLPVRHVRVDRTSVAPTNLQPIIGSSDGPLVIFNDGFEDGPLPETGSED